MDFLSASGVGPSLICLAVALVVTTVLTPGLIRVASRRGWLDRPGFRKVHQTPVPRLGGVAIYLGTWAAWALFATLWPDQIPYEVVRPLWTLFGASTLVWLLGVYDDLRGANAWQKLIVQVIAAILVTSAGVGIRLLYNPLAGHDILTPDWVRWGLTVGWIVVVTNSINLIDGLDGLASGVCMITAGTLYFVSRDLGSPHLPFLSLCLAGACLGFLFFNFSPARIFLGDSGSLFLGFMLACLSILGTVKRSAAIVMYGPPLILGLPVADTMFAIVRRFLRKVQTGEVPEVNVSALPQVFWIRFREIFRADQEHIHHGLLKVGLSHRRAVILLYLVTALLGVTAYRTAVHEHLLGTALIFVGLSAAIYLLRTAVKRRRRPAKMKSND